jgi:hypothetical protein
MPTVLDATLMCSRCDRPTLHIFHERREQKRGPRASEGPLFDDLIYVCEDCEAERIWGSEPKLAEGWASARQVREEHAIAAHGMREVECPACHGFGFDCSECGGKGEIWDWDDLEPCGPECPLAKTERQ